MDSSVHSINERLCAICKPIFTGHWESYSQIVNRGVNAHPFPAPYAVSQFAHIPGAAEEYTSPAMPLQHHSVSALTQSAQQCPLCCMLCTDLQSSDRKGRVRDTSVGFVTITGEPHIEIWRPSAEEVDDEEVSDEEPSAEELSDGELSDEELSDQEFGDEDIFAQELLIYYFDQLDDGSWKFLEFLVSLKIKQPFGGQTELSQNAKDCHDSAFEACIAPTIADSLQRVKGWLASRSPSSSSSRKLPTRLLRLENCGDVFSIRLLNITDRTNDTPYATLSHCWGGHQPIRLLQDNFESFTHNIPFESLPKTFKHAVEIALKLGLSWIWIDSLCIIQDSTEDWLTEAEQMDDVYSHAYVNLAATASTNSTSGMFPKSEALWEPCVLQPTWTGLVAETILVYDQNSFVRQVATAPLNTRGWVFQERVLAPRTVHFSQHHIWWTANDSPDVYVDSFPTSIDYLLGGWSQTEAMLPQTLWKIPGHLTFSQVWWKHMKRYTSLNLTQTSDKLIALAGIAKKFAQHHGLQGTDYLAGLWRRNLVRDLLWRLMKRGSGSRPSEYRAPSWSWASVDGHVDNPFSGNERVVTSIVEADVCTVKGPFGPVKSGFLVLKGPLLRVELRYDVPSRELDCFESQILKNGMRTRLRGLLDDHAGFDQRFRGTFYIAPFFPKEYDEIIGQGLLLRRTAESGEFVRVGFLFVDSVIFRAWKERSGVQRSMLDESDYLQYDSVSGLCTYRLL